MRRRLIPTLLLAVVLTLSCASAPPLGAPLEEAALADGLFEGRYSHGPNRAAVRVTVSNGRIAHIELLSHWAWRGRKAEGPVIERILARQSTDVDAVSGATNSSRVIMNAVEDALDKARKQ